MQIVRSENPIAVNLATEMWLMAFDRPDCSKLRRWRSSRPPSIVRRGLHIALHFALPTERATGSTC